mmetsp:Transcript_5906/g.12960  ORF Transcript_5906/g.12960 Transcript_5906/m.12960 type:complete len:210 (-) Transcript_5906:60-689(-)
MKVGFAIGPRGLVHGLHVFGIKITRHTQSEVEGESAEDERSGEHSKERKIHRLKRIHDRLPASARAKSASGEEQRRLEHALGISALDQRVQDVSGQNSRGLAEPRRQRELGRGGIRIGEHRRELPEESGGEELGEDDVESRLEAARLFEGFDGNIGPSAGAQGRLFDAPWRNGDGSALGNNGGGSRDGIGRSGNGTNEAEGDASAYHCL